MLLESFQMFPIFLSNKKCRLEHVFNKLMSCLITEFLWIFSYKLHGILSNPMDTLWHSMEPHGYFREPHGIPWTNATILHGIPLTSINTSWNSMELHGYSMGFHGTPWILHGTPWDSMELHGSSMEFHGFPLISMEFHGFPLNSMDFHRIPWRYFTREVKLLLKVNMLIPDKITYCIFSGQPQLSGHLPLPWGLSLNSLSPNIQIQILKTDLHTFP